MDNHVDEGEERGANGNQGYEFLLQALVRLIEEVDYNHTQSLKGRHGHGHEKNDIVRIIGIAFRNGADFNEDANGDLKEGDQ